MVYDVKVYVRLEFQILCKPSLQKLTWTKFI